MKNYFYLFAIGAVSLAITNPVMAQKRIVKKSVTTTVVKPINSSKDKPLPNDPNVKIGRLSNGLIYYIRKNIEPKNRAELYLGNKIGSLMENDDQLGLAHFTEHMAFNGTKDFPKNEIINYLQKAGVRFGADLNAYTGFNQTVYQLPIPTDSADVFKTGFKILANWAGKITMDGKEIDNERGVIVEEDRQRGKDAGERIRKQLLPFLLGDSRYEKRLPIGTLEVLNNFTHDKITSFYKDWYRPNLQTVIAVGDFDVNEVEKLIIQNFSVLTNPRNERPRVNYSIPDNVAPMIKIATDPEQPYNVAQVIYKQKQGPVKTVADYRLQLVQNMVNNMLAARFAEITQKGTAPFLFAQSSYAPYQGGLVWGLSALQTVAVAKTTADIEKALVAAIAENERMAKFGFTSGELETVKKKVEAGIEKQFKEKDKTKSTVYVQQYLNNFLIGTAIPSAEYTYDLSKSMLESITLSEINMAAKAMVTKTNQIVVVQAPEKEKSNLPTTATLLTAMKTAGNNITPYIDDTVNKPLIAQAPKPGTIVSEVKNAKIGTTTLVLSNGAKVVLKPTDFKNDQVLFTSFGKGGSSLAGNDDFLSAENANLIAQSGVGDYNPTQLNKYLAGKTASAGAYIDDLYQGFSGSAAPKDLETAFQLIYARATNPRKDAEIFNKNISDLRVITANKNSSPMSVFSDTVRAVLSNYHKRGMPMDMADIDKIKLDKAFTFYKDRFADASGQTFVFVGNFDVEKIKPFVTTYLASLPALNRQENFVDNGVNPPKGNVVKTVKKGLEDKVTVQMIFHDDYIYNAENNVMLDALKASLDIKITERLREKESGVYSPRVSLSVQKDPTPHYYFLISFSCAKANVEKLVSAALEEVNSFNQNGVTAEDLQKFKSEELRQEELSLRENGFWLSYLTNRLKYGDDLEQVLSNNSRINGVTVDATKTAAKKYLNGENYIRLVLMPEN